MSEEYEWFVEAKNNYTYGLISRKLKGQGLFKRLICLDCEKHDLWKCKHQFILDLFKIKRGHYLSFEIWVKESHSKTIRRCTFLFEKK